MQLADLDSKPHGENISWIYLNTVLESAYVFLRGQNTKTPSS